MKTITLALILFLTGFDVWAQMPPATNVAPPVHPGSRFRMGTNGFPVRPAIPSAFAPAAPATPTAPATPMIPTAPPTPAAQGNNTPPRGANPGPKRFPGN